MSTSQSIHEIAELRQVAIRANQSLNSLNRMAATTTVGLQDLLAITRLMAGDDPNIQSFITYLTTTIALVNTARVVVKLLQIEMGPIGWVLLIAGTVGGVAAMDQLARRPQY